MKPARRDRGVGDREPDRLKLGERLTELRSVDNVLPGDIQSLLHSAEDPPRPQCQMRIDIGCRHRAAGWLNVAGTRKGPSLAPVRDDDCTR